MIDLPLGMQAIPIPPLFDWSRYVVHDTSAEIVRAGRRVTISSRAEPWSYLLACPLLPSSVDAGARAVFAWLTQVDARLLSGGAMLACVADDGTHVISETSLSPECRVADLAVGDLANAAWLILRRAGEPATEPTIVSLRGVESFALFDDKATPDVAAALRLTAIPRWSRFYGAPDGGLATQLRYIQFTRLHEPRYVRWLEDLDVVIVPREQMSQAVYVSGLYEPCTSLVLQRLLRPGDTFLDVGANVGWFSMLAARWVGPHGRVISLEPSERECRRLREHVARNHLANVCVLRLAAGRDEGAAVLHVADERHSGLNTLKPTFMYRDVAEAHTEPVRVTTLDRVVEQESVSVVHVIKIDVEGAEYDVLLGARRVLERHKPVVILEVAGEAATAGHAERQALEDLLRSFGYAFAAIDADGLAIKRVDELTGEMENFVAAMPEVVNELAVEDLLNR